MMLGKRGPLQTGQPSKEKYRCPVKNCKSEFRGDDIAKHFRTHANLDALDKAAENQSNSKSLKASEIIELSEVCLTSLLNESSEPEKEHTIYLFHHGYASNILPNYNSVNFKCQQKKDPAANSLKNFFQAVPKKAMKLSSDRDNPGPSIGKQSAHEIPEPPKTDFVQDDGVDAEQNMVAPEIIPSKIERPKNEATETLVQTVPESTELNTEATISGQVDLKNLASHEILNFLAKAIGNTTADIVVAKLDQVIIIFFVS